MPVIEDSVALCYDPATLLADTTILTLPSFLGNRTKACKLNLLKMFDHTNTTQIWVKGINLLHKSLLVIFFECWAVVPNSGRI